MVLLLCDCGVSCDSEYAGVCIQRETIAYAYFMVPDAWLTL